MTKEGTLFVEITSESSSYGYNVPVEVRDSAMRMIKVPGYERRFELPIGLYEVSAVLEDGRLHKQLVQIKEQEETIARLGFVEDTPAPPVMTLSTEGEDYSSYERPRYTQKLEQLTDSETGYLSELPVHLIEVNGARLHKEGRRHWIFECTAELESVANALFQVGDKKVRISLPVSSQGGFPNNSCVVKVEENPSGVLVNAWISKERTIANALQNMIASGYLFKAADMAKDAVELLREKYTDPTGAALGVLILFKVGQCVRWMSWLENLARDFDWLPDGKVILAKLLYDNDTDMGRALDLAIRASSQRMLYSESYSLLLDLLRRWPEATDDMARRQAVDRLASQASNMNWGSICLSQIILEDE
jgi:hypothetical protein